MNPVNARKPSDDEKNQPGSNSLSSHRLPVRKARVHHSKTEVERTLQKAIVCLYLRKRAARLVLCRNANSLIAAANYNEAHNALESLKRVLWHEDWS